MTRRRCSRRIGFRLGFGLVVLLFFVACSTGEDFLSTSPSFRSPPTFDAGPICTSHFFCSNACVDPQRDPNNCGACDKVCGAGTKCKNAKCERASGFALRKIFFGDTDRAGKTDKDAWKAYGRNIDDVVSAGVVTDTLLCKPVTGTPMTNQEDGAAGIDNSFGRNVLPLLTAAAAVALEPSKTATAALESGERTNMIELYNWRGTLDEYSVGTRWLLGEKLRSLRWDGFDIRDNIPYSTGPHPAFSVDISNGVYRMNGSALDSMLVSLTIGSGTIALELEKPVIEMELSPDLQTATNGVLSGIVDVTKMEEAIVALARASNKDLCTSGPNPALDALRQSLRQSADLPRSNKPDVDKECDAVSFAIGFEAGLVVVGRERDVENVPTDPCEP